MDIYCYPHFLVSKPCLNLQPLKCNVEFLKINLKTPLGNRQNQSLNGRTQKERNQSTFKKLLICFPSLKNASFNKYDFYYLIIEDNRQFFMILFRGLIYLCFILKYKIKHFISFKVTK